MIIEFQTHFSLMLEYEGLCFEESISAAKIEQEVTRVANEINADYAGREPLFVCVLNGAFMYRSEEHTSELQSLL